MTGRDRILPAAHAIVCVIAAGCRGGVDPTPVAKTPDPAASRSVTNGWPIAANPGFTAVSAARHAEIERRFLAVPSVASVDAHVKAWSAAPHAAGTPAMATAAEQLASSLRELGFAVDIERYQVYLPRPRRLSVRVRGKGGWTLATRERTRMPVPPADAPELSTWNQYAADGKARGRVVYAGFGTTADFARLGELGIDVRGKVVLARYGVSYRGSKVWLADRAGASAVLLYSDPAEDGAARGDVLPTGPQRPADSIQRGTVVYQFLHAGDPLTPGRPAINGVDRLAADQALDLPRIPVATITAADAERLLRATPGPDAGAGGFARPYHHGPGPVVEVAVTSDWAQREIADVIATIPGELPATIVLGNHIDAWVYGAVDPHSGTSAMFEIARGLAALRDTGWKPRRTIVLAFWDAEEPGVIGSTEWVEHHLAELRRDAVVYLNVDTLAAGALDVRGSPALIDVVAAAAAAVLDPASGEPLSVASLGDLGAGSDWTAFLHHAGVPSLQWTMNGRGTYAVYHSALDDHDYARTWADPGFEYAPAFARVMGLTALRMADADTLPFRYTLTAARLDAAVDDLLASGIVPVDPAPLRAAIQRLHRAAAVVERRQRTVLAAGGGDLRLLDRALPAVEQAFLDDAGHPGRPWYRHMLTAPSPETGFDPVALPEAADAIRAGDAAAARAAISRIAAAIDRGAAVLEAAARGSK